MNSRFLSTKRESAFANSHHLNTPKVLLFALLYLSFYGIESQINSLLECASALLANNISARNMECNKCQFVALFAVLVQL